MLAATYDRPVARFALLLALALPLTASAGTTSFQFFQTPSHNIGCAYSTSPQHLRCDIRTGLKPPPPKPKGCQNDWTFGYQLSGRGPARWGAGFFIGERGRASVVCASGAINFPPQTTLRYGQTWRKLGGFSCTSRKSGLTCRNKNGHGFFLSKEPSRRF